MKRRDLLKWLGLAPAAAVIAKDVPRGTPERKVAYLPPIEVTYDNEPRLRLQYYNSAGYEVSLQEHIAMLEQRGRR